MSTTDPQAIVKTALANGEFDKLLLGSPEYEYRSKYSPAPGKTDLTELLTVIYDRLDQQTRNGAKDALVKALYALSGTYEGINAISACVLFEVVRRSSGRRTLGLPLEDLATRLQSTIRKFELRLQADKTGAGQYWRDGVLGDLRRLSRNTEKYGGPAFYE